MDNEIKEVIDATGKVLETVPEVYGDALKPALQESGKTLSLIPATINAALVPLRKWIAEREYSLEETKKLLEIKLQNVDKDKIVTPDAFIAVPVLQAISYSMDSKEIRNMYANLLARAMLKGENEKVHPAFVEIIKQMSPKDVFVLDEMYKRKLLPIIDLAIKAEQGYLNSIVNISWISEFSHEEVSVSINNLERMGLIEFPFDKFFVDDHLYESVRMTESYKKAKNYLEGLKLGKIDETKKIINITALGNRFCNICINNLNE